MYELFSLGLVILASMCSGIGSLLIKKGAVQSKFTIKLIEFWKHNNKAIAGLALYCVATVFFITALQWQPVSILYPITGLSYVWSILLAKVYLKEEVTTFKWLGILFIVVGVTLIAW